MIYFFDDYIVDVIKCGYKHSYVHTTDGGHYLFGMNKSNECVHSSGYKVTSRINETVMEMCNVKEIVDVSVGYYNTKLICKV